MWAAKLRYAQRGTPPPSARVRVACFALALGLWAACIIPLVVLRIEHKINTLERWPISSQENDTAAQENASYAIVTAAFGQAYTFGAMVMCHSVRRGLALEPHVHLVAVVGHDHEDAAVLRRCFDRVLRDTSPFGLKEYRRVAYLEADTLVLDLDKLVRLLQKPGTKFAAVQSAVDPGLWNGGVAILEPLDIAPTHVHVPTFNPEPLYAAMFRPTDEGVLVLPPLYNVEPRYAHHAQYVAHAVVLHYSLRKPWVSVCGGAYDAWRLAAREVLETYGPLHVPTPRWSERAWDWIVGAVHSCG